MEWMLGFLPNLIKNSSFVSIGTVYVRPCDHALFYVSVRFSLFAFESSSNG